VSRGLKILLVILVLLALGAGGGFWWFRAKSGEEVARRVAARLEAALDGRCKVGGAEVLSTRRVALRDVACTVPDGPLLGFAATHLDIALSGPALRSIPPVQEAVVEDLAVRLRHLPMDMGGDAADDDDSGDGAAAGDDDDSAADDTSLSAIVEALGGRFVRTKVWLDGRPGGDAAGKLLPRIADGGSIQVRRATVQIDEGAADLPLPSEIGASLDRKGDALLVGVVATLSTGGTVQVRAETTAAGLATTAVQLDAVDMLPLLSRTEAFDVRRGTVSGEVTLEAGADGWPVDLRFADLTVLHPFLGETPAALPTFGGAGTIVEDEGSLVLREGRWSVAEETGELDVRLGPLGDEPAVQVRSAGQRLKLGRLLAALPESLLPDDWAEEIQGTMDADLAFGGPLHDRSQWALDWNADFSRMVLADGQLAAQVRRLRGPFVHTFPTPNDAPPLQRTIGPSDDHFVPYDGISSWLSAAVVSTEDAGFFDHSGFEVTELKEAMLDNLREGEGRGGSTITQQLAKNLFLSGDRTLSRKLKEAVISWRLERELPKERILEIYLNIAEWGPGMYGIGDAADHYFARTPAVLKPEEAAFLASLLPSPRRYHGYYHARGRTVTRNRMDRVHQILATMNRLGSLDSRQHHLARMAGLDLAPCGL